ncbi:MAG: hypothetical protein ACFFDW_05855 [Candidatus Thorarchaeota archaeon]
MNNNKKADRPQREKDFELTAKIVLALTIIGIIVSTVLIFTPSIGGEEYAELGILTYNDSTKKYEASNFPNSVDYNQTSGESNSIKLFLLLSNNYRSAKFFEVRLKIGPQNIVITPEIFGPNTTTYFYEDHWIQRVMKIGESWGPSNDTAVEFNFNEAIIDKLGIIPEGYKIIFELWEWNTALGDFSYSGVHTYLTAFQLNLIT